MLLEKQAEKENKKRCQASFDGLRSYAGSHDAVKSSWFYREMLSKKDLKNVDLKTEKDLKTLLKNNIKKYYEKELAADLKKIGNIKKYDFKDCRWGCCQIDWVNNRTWGGCPRGSYKNGHEYKEFKSVTGWGYDKLSTLTARMFNSDPYLLSFIAQYIEKHAINENNICDRLGYGIGISGGLPHFDGGVGVECHIRILKKLGFKVVHHETKKSDYIEFER